MTDQRTYTIQQLQNIAKEITAKIQSHFDTLYQKKGNYAGSATDGGAASSATKLETGRNITTNLESETGASFNGTTAVKPGVTGTLPVKHGGTGASDAATARSNLGAQAAEIVDDTTGTKYTIGIDNGRPYIKA